jgi:hypothetical protein
MKRLGIDRSQSGKYIEHALLLAFMVLASSILVRAVDHSTPALLQCLIWLAAGDTLYLLMRRRRIRRTHLRVARCARTKGWPDAVAQGSGRRGHMRVTREGAVLHDCEK